MARTQGLIRYLFIATCVLSATSPRASCEAGTEMPGWEKLVYERSRFTLSTRVLIDQGHRTGAGDATPLLDNTRR